MRGTVPCSPRYGRVVAKPHSVALAKLLLQALKALSLFDAIAQWSRSDYARIGKLIKYYVSNQAFIVNPRRAQFFIDIAD